MPFGIVAMTRARRGISVCVDCDKVEKDKSNFCDYFSPKDGGSSKGSGGKSKSDTLKALDDLFK